MLDSVLQQIFAALGAIVVCASGLGIIVYGIFKFLAEKWLNAKFEERLAAYRHAQQRELEELRFQINKLMDRTVKLHQKEFDVLPEAWGRLTEAFGVIQPVALGFQQSPDFGEMSSGQFDDFLKNSELAEWEQRELKEARDKSRYYIDRMMWHKLNDASVSYWKFKEYFLKNGIFIPDPIKSRFTELDNLLYEALMERRLSMQIRGAAQRFEKGQVLHTDGQSRLKTLETEVQGRLWNITAAST